MTLKSVIRNSYWAIRTLGIGNPALLRPPRSVLFVCKGNICRSPFAERLAVQLAGHHGLNDLLFSSAGLEVTASVPPPEEALRVATRFGLDTGDHRSRPLTPEMMLEADVVFAVEVLHFTIMRKRYPRFHDRIFLLPLFEERNGRSKGSYRVYNIEDPYGGTSEDFIFCFDRIGRCVDRFLNRVGNLKQQAEK